jgi:hypothetical protein
MPGTLPYSALPGRANGGRKASFEARLVRLVLAIGLVVGIYLQSGAVRALDVKRSLSQITRRWGRCRTGWNPCPH